MKRGLVATRDQRALVGGAVVILSLVAGVRGVPAWRAWRAEVRAAAFEKLADAERTEAVLAALPRSLDTLQARTAQLSTSSSRLLTGETPGNAASNLAAAVLELARGSSVRLNAGETHVDTTSAKPLVLVSLDAQGVADVSGLGALLYGLERASPLMAIRRLVIRPENVASPPDQVETITVRLTVEALAWVQPRKRQS